LSARDGFDAVFPFSVTIRALIAAATRPRDALASGTFAATYASKRDGSTTARSRATVSANLTPPPRAPSSSLVAAPRVRNGARAPRRDARDLTPSQCARAPARASARATTRCIDDDDDDDDDGCRSADRTHRRARRLRARPRMSAEDAIEKTPVTIVTGFLGAGKTTLVNHILRGQHGLQIAVIENEFGAVSIDDALVSENIKEKEDIISMDNGCVCCTVRGDLVRALLTLKDREKKFDAVIIETTGLADPAPVAFTFFINPEIAEHYRIDSILCLADAKHVAMHMEEEKPDGAVNEAVQQVAFADRILLNKIDLVNEEEIATLEKTIRSVNASADVIKTQNSVVDLGVVLGVNSFSLEKTLETDPSFLDENKENKHNLTGVSSVGIAVEGELDFAAMNEFMMNLLQANATNMYRSKGVLCFEGQGDAKFVFQGVHEQINFGPSASTWAEGEPRVNRMVFIGRNLDRKALEAGFRGCLATK
jgi:G3E family GTPase